MAEDLRVLAEDFVRLSSEVEDVRRRMLACLTNGAGETPKAPFAKPVRASGGSQHPAAAKAAVAEARILAMLKDRPMRTSELVEATGAASTTVVQRLNRMKGRGEVLKAVDGWQAAAP